MLLSRQKTVGTMHSLAMCRFPGMGTTYSESNVFRLESDTV